MTHRALVSAILLGVAVGGCSKPETGTITEPIPGGKNYDRPLPPGASALVKVTDPAKLPDFTPGLRNKAGLREAIARSLNYLSKPSSRNPAYYPGDGIDHERVVASLKAFDALLATGKPPAELNAELMKRFDVYMSIGCDDAGTVLFTGYCTPIFPASRKRTRRFRHPLYRQPPDLVKGEEGAILGRRTAAGGLEPYPTRKQIEQSGMLRGEELYWLESPWDVFVAHVQGSAKLRLRGGEVATVGYAATNGHEYVSVRSKMLRDGVLPRGAGLEEMRSYFQAHPQRGREYLWMNPRYVFFTPTEGEPRGSLNEPVTPWRSIATDKSVFPRAALTFIAAPLPRTTGAGLEVVPYRGFALDQDTGGAIRAPGRCDIYMGAGALATRLAGRAKQEGCLYYLMVKD